MISAEMLAYNRQQGEAWHGLCHRLTAEISQGLPDAAARVWHGGPVWFLDGNPIVGYWVRKASVQLLFWSGQSFATPGLRAEGKFKAAEAHYHDADEIDSAQLARWLTEARDIQWDYKNIVRRKGVLEWLKRPL